MDGPVVTAARSALDEHDVDAVLPYVHADDEAEVREAFDTVVKAREQGPEAREVADRFFFETVVRLHRASEGASFTGLKPAGLDVGPVIPVAEAAIETGSPDELTAFLCEAVRRETIRRFTAVTDTKVSADLDVAAARAHVQAVLGLQVWSHKLLGAVRAPAHEHTRG